MKKHVERDSQDTRFFVTTYQGLHNHDELNSWGLDKLHSQPSIDHRANNVKEVAEAAKSICPTKGGDTVPFLDCHIISLMQNRE